jgi:hypothetical protein
MGGTQAISQIQNATVQGTGLDDPDVGNGPTNFVWVISGNDFRYENGNQGSFT